MGDSKNAKTVFFGRNTCLQNKNKMLEVVSAASTAFDVWIFLNVNVISKVAPLKF